MESERTTIYGTDAEILPVFKKFFGRCEAEKSPLVIIYGDKKNGFRGIVRTSEKAMVIENASDLAVGTEENNDKVQNFAKVFYHLFCKELLAKIFEEINKTKFFEALDEVLNAGFKALVSNVPEKQLLHLLRYAESITFAKIGNKVAIAVTPKNSRTIAVSINLP